MVYVQPARAAVKRSPEFDSLSRLLKRRLIKEIRVITYFYWAFVIVLALGTLYLLGWQLKKWTPALIISGAIVIFCGLFYYFYLEQIFVKRWGGTMSINMPEGQRHVAATWKGDNLWIENYDPKTNSCIFQEYSRGNVLEGRVIIRGCNPINLPAPTSSLAP